MTLSVHNSPQKLRGKPVALAMEQEAKRLISENQWDVGLVIVMVGNNAASETYVSMKVAMCERVGIRATVKRLPETTTQETLHNLLQQLNADTKTTGYIVQLPLPSHLSIRDAVEHFDPTKDVDGFTAENAGGLFLGAERYIPPATSHGVISLLEHYAIPFEGKHAVIIGRSNLVGKPLAMELLERNATVTICHSRTKDLARHTLQADILISAVGKAHIVQPDMVRDGAILVDVGFTKTEEGLFGDISPEANAKSAAYAPVPGGVGAVTVAQLITNLVQAHALFHG